MQIWKEKLDPNKHTDFMTSSWIGGMEAEKSRDNLVVEWVYFVKECSFTFQFVSLEQLDKCIEYFSHEIPPNTIKPEVDLEHYWQRWYERLPKGLIARKKREKILKALEKAKSEFDR